ncbi:MAG TPA: hypothetical protein VFE58_18435 [Tepidisphaeraceae bacterium]|nr:hypothetical protein [Tepidisphaeraceae bacterium]
MSVELPSDEIIFRAIRIYLGRAYGEGGVPKGVEGKVEELGRGDVFTNKVVEQGKGRYWIRLGNRWYPHMKVCMEERPDGRGYLFRADTHDRHVRPAEGSKEAGMFRELVEKNAALSKEIEGAWAEEGIPTFRTYWVCPIFREG